MVRSEGGCVWEAEAQTQLAANGSWSVGFASPWEPLRQDLVGSVVREIAGRWSRRKGERCLSGTLVAEIV